MLFFFLPKSSETPFAVFQQMQTVADVVLDKDKSEYNPIQVRAQVPYWMKKSESSMINFLQFYYDWLTEGYGYTGINVMNLSNLPDISSTPEFLLPNYINTYAPDIKGIYQLGPSLQPSAENIRRTIVNIRQEIYQRKSNENAFKSLMASLFGITADTIRISYPKRKLMRLNGGRLEWMSNAEYFGMTGEYSNERYTMVGSHLNQGVFQDSGMWQDFSYLLTSEIDDSNPYYETVVKETLHPAGLLGLYEKIEQYSEGGYDPGPVADYEIPKVANYYPYNLESFETLSKCSGCTGSLFKPGWTFPTFVYPSWDVEIAASDAENFGSIKIWDFFTLNSVPGEISPNDLIGDLCDFACGVCGSVEYAWLVGVGEQFEGDPYTEIPEEPELLRIPDFFQFENPGPPP